MAIRAQPMKTVFSRVPRIIRELEVETGKRVRLEIEGEMTEVDKTVVERIGEPLTHLIRNAVDHGLEIARRAHRRRQVAGRRRAAVRRASFGPHRHHRRRRRPRHQPRARPRQGDRAGHHRCPTRS